MSISHSNLHHHRQIYSHAFGEAVVEEFLEKYGRATEIVARGVGADFGDFCKGLIMLVRFKQFQWEATKKVIKGVHNDAGMQQILRNPSIKTLDKRKYLTIVKSNVHDILLDAAKDDAELDGLLDF